MRRHKRRVGGRVCSSVITQRDLFLTSNTHRIFTVFWRAHLLFSELCLDIHHCHSSKDLLLFCKTTCNRRYKLQRFQSTTSTSVPAAAMNNPNDINISSSNTTHEGSVSVRYIVMCGKPTPDGLAYPFEYSERAPLSLCNRPPSRDPDPGPDATGSFLTSLIERHNDEILKCRAWLCQVCQKPARELFHSAIPLLSPGEGATAEFEPFVWDTVVPICRSGGDCDRKAEKMAGTFGKQSMPTLKLGRKCCERCGKVTGIKLCGGCNVLG